jgi:hypothetical protein
MNYCLEFSPVYGHGAVLARPFSLSETVVGVMVLVFGVFHRGDDLVMFPVFGFLVEELSKLWSKEFSVEGG